MSTTVVKTLTDMGTQVLDSLAGNRITREIPYQLYLTDFAVDSDELTDEHMLIMEGLAAGEHPKHFPFVVNNSNHTIRMIAGMTSQTGSNAHNDELGHRRALNVYAYLAQLLPASQLNTEVQTVGATQPNLDSPGEELGVNRAVGIILIIDMPIIGAVYVPPLPPQDPPPPKSRHWEMSIIGTAGFGLDPVPGINVLGVTEIKGKLRNVRTGEERFYNIIVGGLDLSIGFSTPIAISVNAAMGQFGAFNTHWVDFDDFDYAVIFFTSAGATNVLEANSSAIGFVELNTQVTPPGISFKSALAEAGVQMQYGVMILSDNFTWLG